MSSRCVLATVACSLALVASACDSAPETSPALTTDPVAAQMNALASDPDYAALLARASAVSAYTTEQLNRASPAQRAAWRGQLDTLQAQLASAPPSSPVVVPTLVTELTGLNQAALVSFHADARMLAQRYPALTGAPAQLGQTAQVLAFSMEYTLHPIEECTSEECECTATCDDEYRAAINAAGYEWVAEVWGFQLLGAVIGTVTYIDDAAEAYDEYIECVEACTDTVIEECEEDNDCPSDQYCMHPLGNPFKRCRDKKSLGEVCSRDGKCLSGCCKYHFFSNPLSMVCRPSDKCN